LDRLLKITGDRIRDMVRGRGYPSIELFAHENHIPKSTLSELLNGKNDHKLSTLANICAGLEFSLSELLRAPEIDLWVRDAAPKYDARAGRARSVKGSKRPN
jgi:DNA-binding Xre family transcriptional regulator